MSNRRIPLFITEDKVKIYKPNQKVYMVEKDTYSNNYRPFEALTAAKCGWAYKFSTRKAATRFSLENLLKKAKERVDYLEDKLFQLE